MKFISFFYKSQNLILFYLCFSAAYSATFRGSQINFEAVTIAILEGNMRAIPEVEKFVAEK